MEKTYKTIQELQMDLDLRKLLSVNLGECIKINVNSVALALYSTSYIDLDNKLKRACLETYKLLEKEAVAWFK